MTGRLLVLAGGLALLAGCSTTPPNLPQGAAAYADFPPPNPNGALPPYRIGAFDTIAVSVFQEEDLSVRDIQVDAGGRVLLPLVGQVQAAGRTSTELAAAIASKLGTRYLVNPQVSVIVQDSVSQKVTVMGSVFEPGVFTIRGRTTLLDSLAMAKGLSRVAALNDVAIFREVNGQRTGAVFNVKSIQRGEAQDPQILGNDTVVVGLSNIKAAWRDFLTVAPILAAARPWG